MLNDESHWLSFEDPKNYDRLREVLTRADYTLPRVLEIVGVKDGYISISDVPLVLEKTQGEQPIDVLLRLFLAKVGVDLDALREAIAPMTVESWEKVGLVRRVDNSVFAGVRLLPFDRYLVAQEILDPASRLRPDFVIGIGGATLTMTNFMIRRRGRMTLDLGTGCGLLALLKSSESDTVIATDTNPRAIRLTNFNARINALSNVETREGSLFEPVEGLRFDLILSNAPFVVSPSSGYLFLDGGMTGGQFCRQLASGAAKVLSEGGYCQFLCNWPQLKDRDWREQLSGWFSDTGCDAWVLLGEAEDVSSYARKWIKHFEANESSSAFNSTLEEWMSYYSREGIQAVGSGLVTMRRNTNASNWIRMDVQPEAKNRNLGEDIIRLFEVGDYLNTLKSNDLLMNAVLQPAPELRLAVEYQSTADGWHPVSHELKRIAGLGFTAKTDQLGSNFIIRCDGNRRVADVLQEVASLSNLTVDQMVPDVAHIIRHLVEKGFLLPVPSAQAGKP